MSTPTDIDGAITTLLEQNAGVGTRITPGAERIVVSKGLPRIVYTVLNGVGDRRYSDDGPAGLTQAQYQLDVFADMPSQARAVLARLLKPVSGGGIDCFQGTVGTVKIDRIYFPQPDGVVPGEKIDGKDSVVARATTHMIVEYRE